MSEWYPARCPEHGWHAMSSEPELELPRLPSVDMSERLRAHIACRLDIIAKAYALSLES